MNLYNRIQEETTQINILNKLCDTYCLELDKYMETIDITLCAKTTNDIPTTTIENWIFNITSILYFTVSGLEEVGLKEDMCKIIRQELYAHAHAETEGTVVERQNKALLQVQDEDLSIQLYNRAYRRIKQKVDAGYEMLNSMKKILNVRITDNEISNSRYSGKER